ncbi:DUF1569 domain-containing protein [Polaribacter vadi]|uniref:DUF1569 domain-containing protein n=1 Tax=Polaribacter vadi TaxID=1774273 RepID=UPI0030EB6BF1|tara:strand:- start:9544 stop:9996 length:453 start_codon:yes stop_codon:yes gene_type:complete
MKNIFSKEVTEGVVARIEDLTSQTQPIWGKMSVAQMLAHCCVTYEMVYTDKHPRPNAFTRFMMKTLIKNIVTSEKLYVKNGRTAKQFVITDSKNFETEKKRLIDFITKTQQLGEPEFEGKESHSFGKLTAKEWNNLFYKHVDHHLRQFGV